jgi:simple sugar transport system ATP-binding protein
MERSRRTRQLSALAALSTTAVLLAAGCSSSSGGKKQTADRELRTMGIVLDDLDQPIGTLSGGQRQSVAIARAVHFGARVLILDEPTAALGVKQSGVVLKYIAAARERGLGVIFITHNPHHAFMVGDHFTVLRLGTLELSANRRDVSLEELTDHMAGGDELASLKHELAQVRGVDVEELPGLEDWPRAAPPREGAPGNRLT